MTYCEMLVYPSVCKLTVCIGVLLYKVNIGQYLPQRYVMMQLDPDPVSIWFSGKTKLNQKSPETSADLIQHPFCVHVHPTYSVFILGIHDHCCLF